MEELYKRTEYISLNSFKELDNINWERGLGICYTFSSLKDKPDLISEVSGTIFILRFGFSSTLQLIITPKYGKRFQRIKQGEATWEPWKEVK